MERLTHKRSNGIKTGYWSPDKKDALVQRLAEYENTGFTPEEIKELADKIMGLSKMLMKEWIPVEERLPEYGERCGYGDEGIQYMKRLEIAYMTDTVEYMHGYYDGYKWTDKRHNIIANVVAWRNHKPYRPESDESTD